MSTFRCVVVIFLLAGSLEAQPLIYAKGVVNAASFLPPNAPGGAIGRGSIFSIFGNGIGPSAVAQVSAFPLQNSLSGVSIKFIQGQTSVDVIPLFVSAGQINALMPSNAPLGLGSLQITFNNAKSNMAPVRVVTNAPGIFSVAGGIGPGIVQNFISETDQPINSTKLTAKPGQAVILWLTGLGPVTFPDNVAPTAGDLPFPVEIWVGGKLVTNKLYSGRTPCCSGVDQVVFTIPSDAPSGCFVPVQVRVAGNAVSNAVTMAIDPRNGPCSDSANPFSQAFVSGQNTGLAMVLRRSIHVDIGDEPPYDATLDEALGHFRANAGGDRPFEPALALPPPGSCTVYNVSGDLMDDAGLFSTLGRDLDAGNVSVRGSKGTATLTRLDTVNSLFYANLLGSTGLLPAGLGPAPLFLDPGAVQIIGAGGPEVGAFNASVTVGPTVTWTNRDQLSTINRAQGLTVNWTGTAAGGIVVDGVSFDVPTNASGAFLCLAPAGATSFTVPPYVLAGLPPSRDDTLQSRAFIELLSAPAPVSFTAQGLDSGAAFYLSLAVKSVLIQ